MHVVGGFKKFEDRFNSHYSPCWEEHTSVNIYNMLCHVDCCQ